MLEYSVAAERRKALPRNGERHGKEQDSKNNNGVGGDFHRPSVDCARHLVTLTRLNNRKAELESKLTEIREQIEANNAEIDYISSDEYIDAYAREYLNMKGKDEEAFTGKEK